MGLSSCAFDEVDEESDTEKLKNARAAVCLAKIRSEKTYDVFFAGDSITQGGDFETAFADYNCANIGVGGSTIKDWISYNRAVEPGKYGTGEGKKLFLLVGINSFILDREHVNTETMLYETLIREIKAKYPDLQLYLQSVLPISLTLEWYPKNILIQAIRDFNIEIERVARENGATFIDLHPLYTDEEGYLNGELDCGDGLHLAENAYDLWYDAVRPYVAE